jgi:hypothetical protein
MSIIIGPALTSGWVGKVGAAVRDDHLMGHGVVIGDPEITMAPELWIVLV